MYTEIAERIIDTHNKSEPLYLYVAQQAVHSANEQDPLQAPKRLLDVSENRACAMDVRPLILSRLRKGLFLERPGNFSGPYFEINTCWIVGTVLNSQTGQFASLTASFNVPFSKLLEYKHDKHKTAFRAQNGRELSETGP